MMADDSDEGNRSLSDQLESIDIDAREEPEDESETSDQSGEDAAPSEPVEEQFEEAVRGLSEEEWRRQKFDDGGRPPSSEQSPERGAPARGKAEESRESASEADSLEEALEGLSREEMEARKFAESGGTEEKDEGGSEAGNHSSSGSARADDAPGPSREEERAFEQAMRDVDPMESEGKYATREQRDPSSYFGEESGKRPDAFVTPTLPKSGDGLRAVPPLGQEQEDLLERFEASDRVRELHLRGDRVDEATDRLADALERVEAEGVEFVRIIHGKGRHSEGRPALKPAVLEWLERVAAARIRGYAPERDRDANYGALVVELVDSPPDRRDE